MIRYTIMRPLKECGSFLETTLASAFLIDNVENVEVLFAAEEECSAADIAREVCASFPNVPSKIIIDSRIYANNPKLSNIMKMWSAASGAWIIMADSNIFLPTDTLKRLFSRWNPSVGIVCSPPLGTAPGNFWAGVEMAFLNAQARWQRIADFLHYGFVQGKVMMVSKRRFERLGGLSAMARGPCEDAATTKLMRRINLRIRLSSKLFLQPLGRRSLRIVWDRQVRWAKLRRTTFPFWYSLEIFLTAAPSVIFLFFYPSLTILITIASYIGEMFLTYCLGWTLALFPEMFARDVIMIGVWLTGWFGDDIRWGGHKINLKEKV